MHIFSMNCKADSVVTTLREKKARIKAIKTFRELSITKVYIESYRTDIFVDKELLLTIKEDFENAGFEIAGCIVPTKMSKRLSTQWDSVTCFSDESSHHFLQEIVERTASVFDTIIFDDFLFTSCDCKYCKAGKGERSWGEYRTKLLLKVIQERIIKPARAINKNIKLIIKYPCWYDNYFSLGFDVLSETELFDETWIGTETRETNPQGKAFWIQNWANELGKCGGGWYDSLSCLSETFVEQARNTILGGAKESLLHCYDYLFLSKDCLAKDGGSLAVVRDNLAAQAFKKEVSGLSKLANLLEDMTSYGVFTPKRPNYDQKEDAFLHGFFSMLGIPIKAATSLNNVATTFISAHCTKFDNISKYLKALYKSEIPFVITENAVKRLKMDGEIINTDIEVAYKNGAKAKTSLEKINDNAYLLRFNDPCELMDIEQLDELRNTMLKPFEMELYAPSKVALMLYKNEKRKIKVIQNFNNFTIKVKLKLKGAKINKLQKVLALPDMKSATLKVNNDRMYSITIQPRSMIVLG